MSDDRACDNCGAPLQGEWCHACGQRDVDLERGLFPVLAELIGEAVEADGRLFATARPFLLHPGQLTRDWLDGRRARYTSPARVFVFALFVGFVGVSVAADRGVALIPEDALEQTEPGVVEFAGEGGQLMFSLDADDASLDGFRNQRELAKTLADEMVEAGPKVVVLLVPALAALLQLLLWPHPFLKHLVFSLLLHARLLIFGGLALLVPVPGVLLGAVALVQLYALVGVREAYDLSWRGAVWRYVVAAAAYATLWLGGVIALAVWAAVNLAD
jgi:hypothetical protein